MQQIIVVSDSHKHNNTLNSIFKAHPQINTCIHCGDIQDDYHKLNIEHLYIVSGNTDFNDLNQELNLNIEGVNIYISHGHQHYVDDGLDLLKEFASQHDFQLICFGHTHKALFTLENGIYYLNPGSVAFPRGGLFLVPTYAILTIDSHEVQCTFYNARTHEPMNQNIKQKKKNSFFNLFKNKNS